MQMRIAGRRFASEAVLLVPCAILLLSPLLLVALLVRGPLQARYWNRRLQRHAVDNACVDATQLVITLGDTSERTDLAELTGGDYTLVDYSGEFAAANECGALFELRRRSGGSAIRFALRDYLDRDHQEVVLPLRERGLLPERPKEVTVPRFSCAG
jgi:hypothetical protein